MKSLVKHHRFFYVFYTAVLGLMSFVSLVDSFQIPCKSDDVNSLSCLVAFREAFFSFIPDQAARWKFKARMAVIMCLT